MKTEMAGRGASVSPATFIGKSVRRPQKKSRAIRPQEIPLAKLKSPHSSDDARTVPVEEGHVTSDPAASPFLHTVADPSGAVAQPFDAAELFGRPSISPLKEHFLTVSGFVLTAVFAGAFFWTLGGSLKDAIGGEQWYLAGELSVFGVLAASLVYGSLVYHVNRIAYFVRLSRHKPAEISDLVAVYAEPARPLVTLIPSYKEESRTIEQTVLNAALVEAPLRRVVLLIDDPANPKTSSDKDLLAAARAIPERTMDLLQPMRDYLEEQYRGFLGRSKAQQNSTEEWTRVLDLWQEVATWFKERADEYEVLNHTDALFVEVTFRERWRSLLQYINGPLKERSSEGMAGHSQLELEYRRLAAIYTCEVSIARANKSATLKIT